MASDIAFDPNGWDYDDPHAVARMSATIASRIGDSRLGHHFLNVWGRGGGKAFGLLLCEHIAHEMNVRAGESVLRIAVPPWWSEAAFDQATINRVRAMATDAG